MSANDTAARTTRSGALGRLLLLVGGAVGIGAGADRVVQSRGGGDGEAVVLYGRDWRLGPRTAEHGKRAGPGEVRTPRGRIVDRAGLDLGTFTAASLLGSGGALELHSFDLADGTIVGVGAAGVHEHPFAIVGGTGRYTGAAGTYVARQSPRELGGDGTAEFNLTLTA